MVDAQNKIQCKGRNHGSKELLKREARVLEICLVTQYPQSPAQPTQYSVSSELYLAHPAPSKPHLVHLDSKSNIEHAPLNARSRHGDRDLCHLKSCVSGYPSKTKGKGLEPSGAAALHTSQ